MLWLNATENARSSRGECMGVWMWNMWVLQGLFVGCIVARRSARSNQRKGQVPVIGWSESSLQLTCEENLATSICVESKEEKGTGERELAKNYENRKSESAYKPMIGYHYSRSMYWIHWWMHKDKIQSCLIDIEIDPFLDNKVHDAITHISTAL